MILGCGRSGTSIFGEFFAYLSDYRYLSEPDFAKVVAADFARPQAFKVPRESKNFTADPGLSFPLETLKARAPTMRYFWIVRHPLDAICSLRVGIENSWGHHPRPPDWQDWLERPLIEQCAHHWDYINCIGFNQVARIAKLVRFEEMINDAEQFALEVVQELGIDENYARENIYRWSTRVQNSNNANFVEAMTSRNYSRADHSVRVGRWRENLTAPEIETIVPIIEETAVKFGYDLT